MSGTTKHNGGRSKGTWVTYRPDIKIHDCTIRDGGLINDHQFDDSLVKAVYEACVAAGVDYMEMGYKNAKRLFSPDQYGAWKHCDEDDLRRIVGDNPTTLKLSAMADAERCDYRTDILPKDKSVLDCIRVACYIHQIPLAIDMVKDARDKGYEATINLMAVSTVRDKDLADALDAIAKSETNAIYIVDSFGHLYSEQVRYLTKTYLRAMEGTGIDVGIHAHNNQELAFSNTIEALINGANRLDATVAGIGRGAGNCTLELLIGFLRNPKFRQRPIIDCVQKHFVGLRKKMDWGYSIPYMITGQLNEHPRTAIKMRMGTKPDEYVAFYDQMMEGK